MKKEGVDSIGRAFFSTKSPKTRRLDLRAAQFCLTVKGMPDAPDLIQSPVNPRWLIPRGWEQILGMQIDYRLGHTVLHLWRVQWNQHIGLDHGAAPHAHAHHQLLYYRRGEGRLEANGEAHAVHKGNIFFVPAGCPHRFSSGDDGSALCLALDFSLAQDEAFNRLDISNLPIDDEGAVLLSLVRSERARPFALGTRDQAQVDACIEAIVAENDRRELGYAPMIQAHLLRLISLCVRATQRARGFHEHFRHTDWRHALIAERARGLIAEQAGGECPDFSLPQTARKCGVSPNQLNRILKRAAGATFRQLVLQARLEIAAHLLRSGEANCTEAAFEAGFSDSNYFARAFRKVYGHRPSDLSREG